MVTLRQRKNLDPYAANKLTSNRFGLFFGLAYLVFATTTNTAFSTFLCESYGDDKTKWLIADRAIDCNSSSHKFFMIISVIMILVYPIGTTALYSHELWKHRDAIKDAKTR